MGPGPPAGTTKVAPFQSLFVQPVLGFAMVVMTVMVVMRSRCERRSGEHEDQEHSSKNLLHGGKCSTREIVEIPGEES
jgi:hypothetical protein